MQVPHCYCHPTVFFGYRDDMPPVPRNLCDKHSIHSIRMADFVTSRPTGTRHRVYSHCHRGRCRIIIIPRILRVENHEPESAGYLQNMHTFLPQWHQIFIRISMDILLAIDMMGGFVVQGQSGNRTSYRPLDWGLTPDAEPAAYLAAMKPVYGYVADLDGVEGTGTDNETGVQICCDVLKKSYVNRGRRAYSVNEEERNAGIFPVISTETGGKDLPKYHGGALTVDLKADRVYPTGESPESFLKTAGTWDYDVCIIINLGSVGTERGLPDYLTDMRCAYEGTLFYGGGLASVADLSEVADAGYDGALVATAVHRGKIPIDSVQRGYFP